MKTGRNGLHGISINSILHIRKQMETINWYVQYNFTIQLLTHFRHSRES